MQVLGPSRRLRLERTFASLMRKDEQPQVQQRGAAAALRATMNASMCRFNPNLDRFHDGF